MTDPTKPPAPAHTSDRIVQLVPQIREVVFQDSRGWWQRFETAWRQCGSDAAKYRVARMVDEHYARTELDYQPSQPGEEEAPIFAHEQLGGKKFDAMSGGQIARTWAAVSPLLRRPDPPDGSLLTFSHDITPGSEAGTHSAGRCFPCTNGYLTFDHRDGVEFHEPSSALFLTSEPTVAYDEDASSLQACEIWPWLLATFGEDQLELLQCIAGSVVSSGAAGVHGFTVLYGKAGAGKGITTNWIRSLLPHTWSAALRADDLTSTFGLGTASNKSLLVFDEYRCAKREEVEVIKQISAHEPISVQAKGLQGVTTRITGHMLFVANEIPAWKDSQGGALRRRLNAIRVLQPAEGFDFRWVVRDAMPGSRESLLLWALDGYRTLCESGAFPRTASTEFTQEEMQVYTDSFGVLRELLVETGNLDDHVRASDVLDLANHLRPPGTRPLTVQTVRRAVTNQGFTFRADRVGLHRTTVYKMLRWAPAAVDMLEIIARENQQET